jgi:regulatory protein
MTGNKPYDGRQISKNLEFDEARQKIARFCAYQERAHAEVEEKLYSYGLHRDEVEELLAWLITENFVNEERFAMAFAGGKFRVKRWGKLKIKQYLQQKKVSDYSINKAIDAIEDREYTNSLDYLIEKAAKSAKAVNIFEHRHKISRSMISKGYEPELVWERMKILIEDEY